MGPRIGRLKAQAVVVVDAQIHLQRIVRTGDRILVVADPAEPGVGPDEVGAAHFTTQGIIHQRLVDVAVDALVCGRCADVLGREDRLRPEFVLYAEAVLAGGGRQVFLGKRPDAGWVYQLTATRVGERRVEDVCAVRKRRVRRQVVDVVPLNALEKLAETPAQDRLAGAEDVIGETGARPDCVVVIVDRASRNTVLAREADSVHVEPNARNNGVQRNPRNGRESRPVRVQCVIRRRRLRVCGIEKRRIEVRLPVVLVVSVRQQLPARPELQGQLSCSLPVVVEVQAVTPETPVAFVLQCQLVVLVGAAEQEVGKLIAARRRGRP